MKTCLALHLSSFVFFVYSSLFIFDHMQIHIQCSDYVNMFGNGCFNAYLGL